MLKPIASLVFAVSFVAFRPIGSSTDQRRPFRLSEQTAALHGRLPSGRRCGHRRAHHRSAAVQLPKSPVGKILWRELQEAENARSAK